MLRQYLFRFGIMGLLFALATWGALRMSFPRSTAVGRGRRIALAVTALLTLLSVSAEGLQRRYAPAGGGLWRTPVGLLRTLVLFAISMALLLLARAALLSLARVPGAVRARLTRRRKAREPEPAAEGPEPAKLPDYVVPAAMPRRELLQHFSTAAAGVGVFGVLGYGALRVARDLQVSEVELTLPGLPAAFEGLTIVQLSDVHVGLFTGARDFGAVLERTRSLRPDLVVLTGDLVDSNPAHIPDAMRLYSLLRARLGVWGILGNHDYFTGSAAVRRGLERAGVRMLVNESVIVPGGAAGQPLVLSGLDDLWAPRFEPRGGPDLRRALRDVPHDAPRVVLSHNPATFSPLASRVGLMLSGHTHGGQLNPLGINSLWLEYVAGHYRRGAGQLYVSRGLGLTGPPVRWNAPPEIVRIALTGRAQA